MNWAPGEPNECGVEVESWQVGEENCIADGEDAVELDFRPRQGGSGGWNDMHVEGVAGHSGGLGTSFTHSMGSESDMASASDCSSIPVPNNAASSRRPCIEEEVCAEACSECSAASAAVSPQREPVTALDCGAMQLLS